MHKTEFCLNIYTDGRNTNLEGYYKLSSGTAIPNGASLTGYKTPGNYYCPNNIVAVSLIGSPTQKAFTLKVELSTGNSYPCQTIREFSTGKIYFRTFNIDTNTWSEWGYSIQNSDMGYYINGVKAGKVIWYYETDSTGPFLRLTVDNKNIAFFRVSGTYSK